MTGSRAEARRRLLEEAHEGREEYHSKLRVRRTGPRKRMAMTEFGYDYFETWRNWEPSGRQVLGILIILVVFVGVLIWLLMAGPRLP